MKCIIFVAALLSCALALPAKLDELASQSGYNYDPPAQPAGLYDLPEQRTTTTTTTTTPPPPAGGYLPPVAGNTIVDVIAPAPIKPAATMLMPYNFRYEVDDNEYGTKFDHVADSDGENVTGEYSVLLPDGRMQIVRFTSNPVDGYRAVVTYE